MKNEPNSAFTGNTGSRSTAPNIVLQPSPCSSLASTSPCCSCFLLKRYVNLFYKFLYNLFSELLGSTRLNATHKAYMPLPLSRDVGWPWGVIGDSQGYRELRLEALAEGDPQGVVTEWVAASNSFMTMSCHLHLQLTPSTAPLKITFPATLQHEHECVPWWLIAHHIHINGHHSHLSEHPALPRHWPQPPQQSCSTTTLLASFGKHTMWPCHHSQSKC